MYLSFRDIIAYPDFMLTLLNTVFSLITMICVIIGVSQVRSDDDDR